MPILKVKVALIVAFGLLIFSLLHPALSHADPTDSGVVSVTGSVPPKPSSITTELSVNGSSDLSQDQTVTISVRYRSINVSAIPLKLQVEWQLGQIEGASEPSVEVLDYVIGSATPAYGGTVPVINPTDRTITWDIPSVPSGLGYQTATFQLRTKKSYTGALLVTAPVVLKVLSPIGVGDVSSSIKYRYDPLLLSESTSILPLTATQSATTTSVSTPTAASFLSIALRSITHTTARVTAQVSSPLPLAMRYGLRPTALLASANSLNSKTQHEFNLGSLAPNTDYYYQLYSPTNAAVVSDIFVLTTAQTQAASGGIVPRSVSISQQRTLLFSGELDADDFSTNPDVSVLKNSVIDINVGLSHIADVKTVRLEIRPANVLGASTMISLADQFQSASTIMSEIRAGIYVGKLRTPLERGKYVIIARVEDVYGSVSEEQIGVVRVVHPIRILDAFSQKPIETAEITISVFDQRTQLFSPLSNVTTSTPNPATVDEEGNAVVYLSPARYQLEVVAPGYQSQIVDFEVSEGGDQDYPQVLLSREPNLVVRQWQFSRAALEEFRSEMLDRLTQSAQSTQLFRTLFAIQVGLIISLSLLLWYQHHVRAFEPEPFWELPVLHQLRLAVQFLLRNTVRLIFEMYQFLNVAILLLSWGEFAWWAWWIYLVLVSTTTGLWFVILWNVVRGFHSRLPIIKKSH